MAAEKPNIRKTVSTQGNVKSIAAPNARQTFVPQNVPQQANGVAAQIAGSVPAVLAKNARSTHIQSAN